MADMKEAFNKSGIFSRKHFQGVGPYGPGRGFSLTLTPFEIPVWILVDCEEVPEGIKILRGRNLNRVTTRCRTYERARQELVSRLVAWYKEPGSRCMNYIFHDKDKE